MYSLDLRQRVVDFVKEGGTKAEAARRYRVAQSTVYGWLNRTDLKPTLVKRRRRKLNWDALREHVKHHPDAQLSERTAHFGVAVSSIHYALKEMKITRKKRTSLSKTLSSSATAVPPAAERFAGIFPPSSSGVGSDAL